MSSPLLILFEVQDAIKNNDPGRIIFAFRNSWHLLNQPEQGEVVAKVLCLLITTLDTPEKRQHFKTKFEEMMQQ